MCNKNQPLPQTTSPDLTRLDPGLDMHSNKMAILWVIVRILFVSLVCLALPAWSQVQVTPDMTSFSSAIKGGHLKGGEEKVLYARNHMSQPGVITEQWFTGAIIIYYSCVLILHCIEIKLIG